MKNLAEGSVFKGLMGFVMPMLMGNIFQQLFNVVDTWIIGNYVGKEALGAVGASFPIIFVLISIVVGISTGATVIISQYFGAKNIEKVKLTIDTTMVFLFIAAIIITISGLMLSEQIFIWIKLPVELRPEALTYFNIYLSGLILLFGYNAVSAILRGIGDSKTPLYFLIIATILNIILDLVFVLVFKWGVAGVAIATVISQGVAFVVSVIYLNATHDIIRFSFKRIRFDKDIFYKSLKIGIPTGMQHTFVSLGMVALMVIVNTFGTDTIAAYTIAGRIDSFALLPAMNFSMALTVFVGQNIGANRLDRVREGYKTTLLMNTLISIVLALIAILFGKTIVSQFTNDINVINTGYEYLLIVSPFYIIFSFMFVNHGLLKGAGATLIPMFITLLSLWGLRIPVSYFLSQIMGTNGIWWGIPVAWFFGGVFSYLYYVSGKWKKHIVIKHESSPTSEHILHHE